MIVNTANPTMSTTTMVAPTGVPARMEIKSPTIAHTTEKMPAQMVTDLKLLNTCIADSAGKITNAEIKSEPTRFIASTITAAIKIAIKRL